MWELNELKTHKFKDITKKTLVDNWVKELDLTKEQDIQKLKRKLDKLKEEAMMGQILSFLDDVNPLWIELTDSEKNDLLSDLKDIDEILTKSQEKDKKAVTTWTKSEVSVLKNEVSKPSTNTETLSEIKKELEWANQEELEVYIEDWEEDLAEAKKEWDDESNIQTKLKLAKEFLVKQEKLEQGKLEQIKLDETTISKVLDEMKTKKTLELTTYISSLEEDIGNDTLKFEKIDKQLILAEAYAVLGKKLLNNPDEIDKIKSNFPIKSIEKSIFGFLTEDPFFAKRYKQAYDNTSVEWTETYIPEDVEWIKRFEVFKISVNHEHTNISPDVLDDIFKNKLALTTTEISDVLWIQLGLGEKLSRLEKEDPDIMELVWKHGVLWVAYQLINKTKMWKWHRSAAMVFAELAAIWGVFYWIFKTIKKMWFLKWMGALILWEFTASAITWHGAFDLVGRAIYWGLDQVDFSGATGKTKKLFEESKWDKEKKKELWPALLMGMILGEEMKISEIKKYSELKNGKVIFNIDDFKNSLPKNDWRRDFLEKIIGQVGVDKIWASFVDGLEKIWFNATTYTTMKDTTIGALFDQKRKEKNIKKTQSPKSEKTEETESLKSEKSKGVKGNPEEDKDKKKTDLTSSSTWTKEPINPINTSELAIQDLETIKKTATTLLRITPIALLSTDIDLSWKKEVYESSKKVLEEYMKKGNIVKNELLERVLIFNTILEKYNNAIIEANNSIHQKKNQEETLNQEILYSTKQVWYIENGISYLIWLDKSTKKADILALNPELKESLVEFETISSKVDDLLFFLWALVKNDSKKYKSILQSFQKQLEKITLWLDTSNINEKVEKIKTIINSTLLSISGDIDIRSFEKPIQTLCNSFNTDPKDRRTNICKYIRDYLDDTESVQIDIVNRRFNDYTEINDDTVLDIISSLDNTDIDTLVSNIFSSTKWDKFYNVKTLYWTKGNIKKFIKKLNSKSEDAEEYYLEMQDTVKTQATKLYPNEPKERTEYINNIKEDIKYSFLLLYTKNLLISHKLEKESNWDRYKGKDNDMKILSDIEWIWWLDMSDKGAWWLKEGFFLIWTEILALAAGAFTFGIGTYAVNTTVYGTRWLKIAKYAYRTGKYAEKAFSGARKLEQIWIASARFGRWGSQSIIWGASFYAWMWWIQSLIEWKNMYDIKWLWESIVFMWAFNALHGLYRALGKSIDFARPLSEQKLKITSQFLAEWTTFAGMWLWFEWNLKPWDWDAETILQAFIMAGLLKTAGVVWGKYSFRPEGKKVIVEKMELEYNNNISKLTSERKNLHKERKILKNKIIELENRKKTLTEVDEITKLDAEIIEIQKQANDISSKLSLIKTELSSIRNSISNLENSITEWHFLSYENFSKNIWYKLPKKSGDVLELYKNNNIDISIRNTNNKLELIIKKDWNATVLEFKNQKQLTEHIRKELTTNDFRLLVENNYQKILNKKIDILVEGKGATFKIWDESYRIQKIWDKKTLQKKEWKNRWKEESLDDFFNTNYDSIVNNYLKGMEVIIKKKWLWNKKIPTTRTWTPPPIPWSESSWGFIKWLKDFTYWDLIKWAKILKSDISVKEKMKVSMKKVFLGHTEWSTVLGKFATGVFLIATFGESMIEGKYKDSEWLWTLLDSTTWSDMWEFMLYNTIPLVAILLDSSEYIFTDESPSTWWNSSL